MKITLSRDEIKGLVKAKYGITTDDFILEINNEGAKATRQVVDPVTAQPKEEPEVEYDIKVDSNGFITDMVPKNNTFVPFKDDRGRTFNYQNTCKICGKTFYTMTKPATVCSGSCLDKLREQEKKDAKQAAKKPVNKPEHVRAKHIYDHVCVVCNKAFTSDGPRSLYCSEACKRKAHGVAPARAKKHNFLQYTVSIPKNPKLDYTSYAERIEAFLNSNENELLITDNEGISLSGMRDRFRVAANMFDLATKVHITYSAMHDTLTLRRA